MATIKEIAAIITIPAQSGILSSLTELNICPPTTLLTTDQPITPIIATNATNLTNHQPNKIDHSPFVDNQNEVPLMNNKQQ